jgi:hypothetical protein
VCLRAAVKACGFEFEMPSHARIRLATKVRDAAGVNSLQSLRIRDYGQERSQSGSSARDQHNQLNGKGKAYK